MMATSILRMTDEQHRFMMEHLFPGDGFEAVLVALCGRRQGPTSHILTVHDVVRIPYDECRVRNPERVTWSTNRLVPLLKRAAQYDMAILKVHSHPGGLASFSTIDDAADLDLFGSVFGWVDGNYPHASAVMLPDGRMFGRFVGDSGSFIVIDRIAVMGDDLVVWDQSPNHSEAAEFTRRHSQLFGKGTIAKLRSLAVGVVGCSGTGSPLIEMLARLGVGKLTLVDPDLVEEKNLNRILNTTREDANLKRPKVEVLGRAIERMGFDTELELISDNLATPHAVRAVASCDIIFGCVDSVEGRSILNRISSYYCLPYFDVGVKLVADGEGGINEACGAVHYVKPGGESLLDRRAYSLEQLKSEGLRRTDPAAYKALLEVGYIKGVQEDRPAVISINMQLASMAVNEFLARLHPYRFDGNSEYAVVRHNFMDGSNFRQSEGSPSASLARKVGRGDARLLLDMPELSEELVA